jgi:hypothetical protein
MTALVLAAAALLAAPAPVVVAHVERPVLALAPLDSSHLLLLEDDRLSVWRITATALVREGERETPAAERVRWPAGLIHAPAGEGSAWVLRSGWGEARLVRRDDSATGGLAEDSQAVALPWPGAPPSGVRFRAGTSLVEGPLAALGDGPYLALAETGGAAVDAEGVLRVAHAGDPASPVERLRVGSALAQPWPDTLVASSAAPEPPDALLVILLAPQPCVATRVPLDGRVRALAATTNGAGATIFAALEDGTGSRIVRVEIPRPKGDGP